METHGSCPTLVIPSAAWTSSSFTKIAEAQSFSAALKRMTMVAMADGAEDKGAAQALLASTWFFLTFLMAVSQAFCKAMA